MKYIITKEACQAAIDKRMPIVCCGCGGKLEPIKTVDNANQPTYWSGCLKCSCFDNGTPPKVFNIAKIMVEERGYRSYREIMPDKENKDTYDYWLRSQIKGTVGIVIDILNFNNLMK